MGGEKEGCAKNYPQVSGMSHWVVGSTIYWDGKWRGRSWRSVLDVINLKSPWVIPVRDWLQGTQEKIICSEWPTRWSPENYNKKQKVSVGFRNMAVTKDFGKSSFNEGGKEAIEIGVKNGKQAMKTSHTQLSYTIVLIVCEKKRKLSRYVESRGSF